MGVVVEALRVKDEFRPLESVNWLLANIGEKITIELSKAGSDSPKRAKAASRRSARRRRSTRR